LKWDGATRGGGFLIRFEHPQIQAIGRCYLDPDMAGRGDQIILITRLRLDVLLRVAAAEYLYSLSATKELNDFWKKQFAGNSNYHTGEYEARIKALPTIS